VLRAGFYTKISKLTDANIINPDLMVDNGICHAIVKVLMAKMAELN
jgi:hypothetical protein